MRRTVGSVEVDFAELTDAGRDPAKQINEDSCAYVETAHGHLAVVCDGMGGHTHGRRASREAIRIITETFRSCDAGEAPRTVLERSIRRAGAAVHTVGGDAPPESRPGTTCVAVLLHERGAEVAHVGDSRAYLIRDGDIVQLTRDHSIVQDMLDAGLITQAEALEHPDANKITRALGMTSEVDVDLRATALPFHVGDILLLCTDGLTDLATDEEISSVVNMNIPSGAEVPCERLVNLANLRGGYDNITVQVVRILAAPATAEAPEPTVVGGGAPVGPTVLDDGARAKVPSGAEPVPPTAEPTALGGALAPTVVEVAEPPERQRTGTVPDGTRGAGPPGPTLVEGAPAVAGAARPAPGSLSGRSLLLVGALAAAVIVVGVLVWWAVGGSRRLPAQPVTAASAARGSARSGTIEELFPDAEVPPPAAPAPERTSGSKEARDSGL